MRKKSEWGLGVDRFRAVELGREKVDECHVINLSQLACRDRAVTTTVALTATSRTPVSVLNTLFP